MIRNYFAENTVLMEVNIPMTMQQHTVCHKTFRCLMDWQCISKRSMALTQMNKKTSMKLEKM